MGDDPTEFVHDVHHDADEETVYECLSCGHRVVSAGSPVECPECEDALRNTGVPLE